MEYITPLPKQYYSIGLLINEPSTFQNKSWYQDPIFYVARHGVSDRVQHSWTNVEKNVKIIQIITFICFGNVVVIIRPYFTQQRLGHKSEILITNLVSDNCRRS